MISIWLSFQAAVDRGFLSSLQQGFGSSSFNDFFSKAVFPLAVFLLLVIVIGLSIKYIKIKQFLNDIPTESRVRKKDLVKILKQAMDSNCAFELRFFTGKEKRKPVLCTLQTIESDALTFRIEDDAEPGKEWIERSIESFFHLCDTAADSMNFYMFSSTVVGVYRASDQPATVQVKFPKAIPPHQKRHHLRIAPPAQHILGLALWPDKLSPNAKPETNLKKWGKPPLSLLPGEESSLRIDNISNSGMRLAIDKEGIDRSQIAFRIASLLLALLDLHDPRTQKRMRFLLRCRVQNIFEGQKAKDMEVGLRFLEFGQMRKDSPSEVVWKPIGDEGLTPVADWVLWLYQELGVQQIQSPDDEPDNVDLEVQS